MDSTSLRRVIYSLLTTVAIGITLARIMAVEFLYEPSLYQAYPTRIWPEQTPEKIPTFSSNDRSRWATIRALVEEGTFVIGHRIEDQTNAKGYRDEGIVFQDGYKTIDLMMNPKTNEFYSTKPPLFTLIVAGEYGLLKKFLGWDLDTHRWEVICTILITFNAIPLLIFLILLARLLEEYGTTDFGRIFVFAVACFGTFLTTFAVTLNNHTPAACCVLFALYPLLNGRSATPGAPISPLSLLTAGFFAGFSICLDLPAAAFAGSLFGFLVLSEKRIRPILYFFPALLIPLMALMWTNFLALGEWNLGYSKFGGPWYEFKDSYWLKAKMTSKPGGIDFADEPKLIYAFHLLFGHHGLFSLTPVWLLAFAGIFLRLFSSKNRDTWLLAGLSLLVSLVVIGFYIKSTNNYGGWSSGPRWLFFLTPLFLLGMLPALDRLERMRIGRGLAYFFLAISAFSAFYPVWNPWRHPWIYQLCEYMNWIRY